MKNNIKKYDKSNMFDILKSFHQQIDESFNLVNSSDLIDTHKYESIIFCGMGGSSIGASFIQSNIFSDLLIPSFVNNGYDLPNWVNDKTLVVIISYSGDTEETICNYNDAINKNIKPWIISSGGYLLNQAVIKKYLHVILPHNFPPRTAFGFISSVLILLLAKNKFINNSYIINLKNSINLISSLSHKYCSNENNDAVDLAKFIFKKNIIIYSSPLTKVLGYRFKSQLSENSKILSYYHYLPELNHNDVEGYVNLNMSLDDYSIIWLLDYEDDIRIKKKVNSISTVMSELKNQKVLNFKGNSLLERQYHLLYFLDLVSFYLAILYKTDPTPVDNIKKIKSV